MAKRPAENGFDEELALKNGQRISVPQKGQHEDFEDEFEDEFESENEILEAGVDGRPDEEREAEEKRDAMDVDQKTFIPGRHKLANGESLSPDLSTYELLHALSTPWPCLSFDIIRDDLGDNRKTYPASFYAVAGTQADSKRAKDNQLMVMKLSGLSRMERDEGEDSDEESDSEEIGDPILETKSLPTGSTTNRVRAHRVSGNAPSTTFTATMLESSKVLIHNITPQLTSFDAPGTIITPQQSKPVATLTMHKSEGYAVDWSPLILEGKLLTGDNDGHIFVTTNVDGQWSTDSRPFTGHESSIEDLQWSPNEKNVFASASSDGTVKIWDSRSKSHKSVISVQVSSVDVNVLSWSKQTPHLIATGADDGRWSCWDLRQWKSPSQIGPGAQAPKPVASFDFHKEQITSVEWHPTDDSIVAVAAGDNTLTLWDLAVELDDEESKDTADAKDVPPQLLFVHYMEQVKECHWHSQIPGLVMATGDSGFGVFKTINQSKGGELENPTILLRRSSDEVDRESNIESRVESVPNTSEFSQLTFESLDVSEEAPRAPPTHKNGADQEPRDDLGASGYTSFPAPFFHTEGKPRALDSRSYPEYSLERPRYPSAAHHSHAHWHPNSSEASPDRAESIYHNGREVLRSEPSYTVSERNVLSLRTPQSRSEGFNIAPANPDIPSEFSQRLASRFQLHDATRQHRRPSTRSWRSTRPEIHGANIQARDVHEGRENDVSRQHLRGGFAKRLTLQIEDDERVPKFIWYTAGGMGRPPTGKGVKEWKRRHEAQKAKEKADVKARNTARKERKVKAKRDNAEGGFWKKFRSDGKGKKLKKGKKGETPEEAKEGEEGTAEGATAGEANGGSDGSSSDAPEAVE